MYSFAIELYRINMLFFLQMANFYTLLLRNGSMVAPKICSSLFRYDALVDFACSKWYDLNGRNFGFSYVMDTVG